MKYQIRYGTDDVNIDITQTCLDKCKQGDIVYIPTDDNTRAELFTDPLFGVVKTIYVYRTDQQGAIVNDEPLYLCDANQYLYIDVVQDRIHMNKTPVELADLFPRNHTLDRLREIHTHLQLKYGDFSIEVPEQLMALRYLTGQETILEIGGNIGRNSTILSYILESIGHRSSRHLVTLESDPNIAKQLEENRSLNGYSFHVEPSALSKRKLIQGGRTGWETFESDVLLEGYNWVHTITWDELREKYPLPFDTLVLDCEGAFYNILKDMPEVLEGITKILIENDFRDVSQKQYVDRILLAQGFTIKYSEDLDSGYYWLPWKKDFFQYWSREKA